MKDSPYVGPVPFGRDDAPFFAGRDLEATELTALIKAHCLTILYAPSGAGKTSLLNALVVPRLEQEYCDVAPIARVAGAQSTETGIQPVLRLDGSASEVRNPFAENLLASLDPDASVSGANTVELLASLLAAAPEKHADDMPRLRIVIIDQFEELFTKYPESWAQRRILLQTIATAIEAQPSLSIVLSMREEYVPALEPLLAELVFRTQRRFRLPLLGPEQAAAAIREPAAKREVEFLADAVELQVKQLRGRSAIAGRLPTLSEFIEPITLQIVCRRIWAALPEDTRHIDTKIVEEAGRVEAALEAYFDECISAASRALAEPEWKLRGFVQSNLIDARNQRRLFNPNALSGEAVAEATRFVVELEERRILRPEVRHDETSYELAHDQFVPAILRSNAAQKGALDALLVVARRWHATGKSDDQLLSTEQVESARQWMIQNDPNGLTGPELPRYIERSAQVATEKLRQRKSELEAKQQQLEDKQHELTTAYQQLATSKRKTDMFAAGLALLVFVCLALAWTVWEKKREASATAARIYQEVGLLLARDAHPSELLSTALALSAMGEIRTDGEPSRQAKEVIGFVLNKFPSGRAYWKDEIKFADIPSLSANGSWSYIRSSKGDYLVDLRTFRETKLETATGGFPEFVGADAYVLLRPAGYMEDSPRLLLTATGEDRSNVFEGFGTLIDCCDFSADGSLLLIQGVTEQGEARISLRALTGRNEGAELQPIKGDAHTSLLLSADGKVLLKIVEKSADDWSVDAHLAATDDDLGHVTGSDSELSKRDFRLSKTGRVIAQLSNTSRSQGEYQRGGKFQVTRAFYSAGAVNSRDRDALSIWSNTRNSGDGKFKWTRSRVDTSQIGPIVDAEFLDDATLLVVTRRDGRYRASRLKLNTAPDSPVLLELQPLQADRHFHDFRFVPAEHPVALHLYGQTDHGPDLLIVTADSEKSLSLRPLPDGVTSGDVLLSANGDTAVHLVPSGGVASFYKPSDQVTAPSDLDRRGCQIIRTYRSQQPDSALLKATDPVCAAFKEGT